MRTTVDIPDPIYRELKVVAARQGTSVKKLILKGVENELDGHGRKTGKRITLPIFESKRPGSLKLTNKKIDGLLLP